MLEAMGMQWAPGFENTYHGITVDQRLRRDVTAASREYSHQDFITDRFKFYGKAHKTPLALENIDNYNLGFMNAAEQRIVRLDNRPLHWVDPEQTVLDTKGMYLERLKGRPSPLRPAQ